MRNPASPIRYLLPAISIMLLLAGCGRNRYKPVSDSFDYLLQGSTAVDTLFVAAMSAPTAERFDADAICFFEAYARDFDDPGITRFSPRTPYALRQDSLLFFMQDYLLNTYRYEESIRLGRYLGSRLTGSRADQPLHSASLGDIGVAFFYSGNLEEAISYQREGYEIDMRLGEPDLMSSDLNQLAAMCLRSGKYNLARDYILDAIKIEEPLGRPATLAIRYGLASEIYLKLHNYPVAATYARKALELDRREGREGKVGIRLSQLAAVQIAQDDTAAAEESLARALPLLKAANNINSLAIVNCQLGELALKRGDDTRAQQYFYEALLLCRKAGIKPIEKRALHGLWLAMKDTNPRLGSDYLEHYSALADSLGTVDSDSQLATLKAEFATRELRMDNERLEIQNHNNRIIIAISAILLVTLCLVGWLIYRNRSSRQRLMRHMEQVRINFFTNITHEFRTPLTVILGLSDQLRAKEDARQQAEIISEEGLHLLDLVNQLLDIGKISSAAGNAEWRHGNIIGYFNMLVESLRPLAVSRDVELVFSPVNNEVDMDFVPDYLRKIVVNILSNALKYTGGNGRILISAHPDSSHITLRFADNGAGIDGRDIEHIFEPFYQGTNSKTTVGTGVGLSLVKLLVNAMDGEISVKSSVGIGTVFILRLPLRRKGNHDPIEPLDTDRLHVPALPAARPVPADPVEDGERTRPAVLIVEDNPNVADYMTAQLADHYHIYRARNGEEGFNKALNVVPDLIITDIMMPVMDGIELVKKLRSSDILNHLPIMMVTARATDTDRVEGINAGADAYIHKPFNADELRAVVAHLIEQRRLLCEKYLNMARQLAVVDIADVDADADADTAAEDRAFLGHLINIIYHLISTEHRTDIAEIASRMAMSERSLSRKVQALTGDATVTFINRVKIDKAKRLLEADRHLSLADIATRCGFDDPAYFSRLFKQMEGVSPTTYRRMVK